MDRKKTTDLSAKYGQISDGLVRADVAEEPVNACETKRDYNSRQRPLMTVLEWVQTYLANLFRELFDAFRCLVELLSIFCGLDLVFQSIAFRDQLEDTREISTLLRGYLGCGGIRGRCTVSEGKDGRSTEHSEVV